jgi:hypothetical protein
MADDATLKDVTASPNPADAAVAQEPVKQEPVATAPLVDADAAEIGRILLDSGYTKEQLNDIMQAPTALASLRHLITDNPQELINLLDRTSPDAAKKLLDTAADVYVKRYGKDDPKAGSDKKDGPSSELMAEVEGLRTELNQFRTQREQEQARLAMAQVKSRYDARVEDLFNQLPKDTGLTKAETKALRARVDAELAADPTIVQRVSTGNFVDVPHKFKAVIDEWSSDRKAAAKSAEDRRLGVNSNASPEFSNGPNPFMPANHDFANSWDDTEAAFAKALTQAPRS